VQGGVGAVAVTSAGGTLLEAGSGGVSACAGRAKPSASAEVARPVHAMRETGEIALPPSDLYRGNTHDEIRLCVR